jgi:hypothetical protein
VLDFELGDAMLDVGAFFFGERDGAHGCLPGPAGALLARPLE